MRSMRFLTACGLLGLAAVVMAGAVAAQDQQRKPMKITYLGNSGFLIETEKHKVLIDGLFRAGVEGLMSMPAEQRTIIEGGQPPYDNVDLVLVTHNHPDHVEPIALGTYLTNNPKSMLLTTPGVVERLQIAYRGYDDIHARVGGFTPPPRPLVSQHEDIRITAVKLDHLNLRDSENIAFVVEMDGWKFYHGGDGIVTLQEFLGLGFTDGDLDVAFLPYWYIASDVFIEAMRRGLDSKHVIVTHLPPKRDSLNLLEGFGGRDGVIAKMREVEPTAFMFDEQFDSKIIE